MAPLAESCSGRAALSRLDQENAATTMSSGHRTPPKLSPAKVQRQGPLEWRQGDCVAGAADTFSSLRLQRLLCWTTFEHQSCSKCCFCSCAKIRTVYASFVSICIYWSRFFNPEVTWNNHSSEIKSKFSHFFKNVKILSWVRWLPASSNVAPASEAPIASHLAHQSR